MIDIYKQLYSRNLGNQFEDFIRRRFPYIVESDDIKLQRRPKRTSPKKKSLPPSAMNKHGVFKSYKPGILSFPHKLILVDSNSEQLVKRVKDFLADKVKIDYLIIGDTAYIEYLMKKYEDILHQIPQNAREIEQFRRKMAQK